MILSAFCRHPVPGFLPFGLPLCPFCHCFDFQPLNPWYVRIPYSLGLPLGFPHSPGCQRVASPMVFSGRNNPRPSLCAFIGLFILLYGQFLRFNLRSPRDTILSTADHLPRS